MKCTVCGITFSRKRWRRKSEHYVCSKSCHDEYLRQIKRPKLIEFTCICGKKFELRESYVKRQQAKGQRGFKCSNKCTAYITPSKTIEQKCTICGKQILRLVSYIKYQTKKGLKLNPTCSKECAGELRRTLAAVKLTCEWCGKEFARPRNRIRGKRHFCSQGCSSACWHAEGILKTGANRSKFEEYVEKQLAVDFPQLSIKFNDCHIIGSELDIWIPELNLAVEINGITHKKPIYGQARLDSTMERDRLKAKKCIERDIQLVCLDVSEMTSNTRSQVNRYYRMLSEVIHCRLSSNPQLAQS